MAVESEVLGKGLEEHDVVGVLAEESESHGIFFERSTGESLVGVVETAVEVLAQANFEDGFPLLLCGINPGWVVSARVKNDEGVVLCSIEVCLHAFEVESFGSCVIVTVVLPVVANQLCNLPMDRPGWVWNQEIDVLVRVPLREECEADSESSSSGKGLSASNSALFQLFAICSKGSGL